MSHKHTRHTTTHIFCLFLLFFLAMGMPSPDFVHAQDEKQTLVQLLISPGFDGHYRRNQWFPIVIDARNDGPDIRGVIEWAFLGTNENNVFQQTIDLPRGAQKRFTLYAYSTYFDRIGQIRVKTGKTVHAETRVQLTPLDTDHFTVGVVSNDTTLLNSLSDMQIVQTSGTSVIHIEPAFIPEDAQAMSSLDVLVVHDISISRLTENQQDAIRRWVLLGGQLIVSGGINANQTTSGVTDILPVTVGDMISDASLVPLQEYVPDSTPQIRNTLPNAATINQVTPHDGAVARDEANLITTRAIGNGTVIFCAFDVGVLRAWVGEPDMWKEILHPATRFDATLSFGWWGNLLRNVLELPSLNLPSFGLLSIVMLFYIVVVGPINFLVLRHMKRVELAWITIPVLVLLFIIGTYSASFLIRGTKPELFQLSIVEGFEGYDEGLGTSHIGIFSPNRRTYTLGLDTNSLVRLYDTDSLQHQSSIVWNDTATEIPDMLVDVSSLRTFVTEHPVDIPLTVKSALQQHQGKIWGSVTNTSDVSLEDAILVYSNSVQNLDTLAPGETAEISLERDMFNFPDNATTAQEGVFNRKQMLFSLYNQRGPMREEHGDNGVYIMAWHQQPLFDIQINTGTINQQALILYVIRLDTAR